MRPGHVSWSGKASANAIRNALKQEKVRFENRETERFAETKKAETDRESLQKFPRTLGAGTFFTPHLVTRRARAPQTDIVQEYAAVLKVNEAWVVSRPTFNPLSYRLATSSTSSTSVLPECPQGARPRVLELESQGFQFSGKNGNMLVFERQFNQKQRDRRWVSGSALAFTGSVALLTVGLFAGEYFF